MALVLTIDGNDRTSILVTKTLRVEQRAEGFISVCSLTLVDAAANIAVTEEDSITVVDGAITFFAGRVVSIDYKTFTTQSRNITLKCQDNNAQLGEVVIDQAEAFAAEDDAVIIDTLFDDYLPAVDSETFVDTIQDPLTITVGPTTMRTALSQIGTRTGGYFYVDAANKLHYFTDEANDVGWGLSDSPGTAPADPNLVANPSIETNTTGWATAWGDALARSSDFALHGDYSLKITGNGDATTGAYTSATVVATTTYDASMWFYVPADWDGSNIRLRVYEDTFGTLLAQSGEVTERDQWVQRSVTVTPSLTTILVVGSGTGSATKSMYIDQVRVGIPMTTYSYFDKPRKSTRATTRLDGVFVAGDGVSGWTGDHGAGDRTTIVRDNRISTATGVTQRGTEILTRWGSAQVLYHPSTYKAGLTAGMEVRFVCTLYNVDDTFTVRKMVIRWDEDNSAVYNLELGDAVNPSLIGGRIWTDNMEDTMGPVSAPRLPTSSRGWGHAVVFSATDNDTIEWAGGADITLADGTTYTIDAGNTGNMAAKTYIYLDIDTSTTVLQTTTDVGVAVGTGKILVAWGQNQGAGLDATFFVFGGVGQGPLVDTANIAGDAITSAKILANTIEAGDIKANTITASEIAANTITTNEIAANTIVAGNIAAGAIETDELAALAVIASKIAASTITADKLSVGGMPFDVGDGLLLLGPYGAITTTSWRSTRGQLATLSGAFHREQGYWQGTRGLAIEPIAENLVTNPSLETGVAGWTQFQCTRAQSSDWARFGVESLKITTAASGGYVRSDNLVSLGDGDTVTATVYATADEASRFRLSIYTDGAYKANSSYFSETGDVRRYEVSWTNSTGGALDITLRIKIEGGGAGSIAYCDAFQLEETAYATSYCDGSLGTGYSWSGAAHTTTSDRVATECNLDASVGLVDQKDKLSVVVRVQMPYDYDATWPQASSAISGMLNVATTQQIILYYDSNDDRFELRLDDSVDNTTLTSAAQTFVAGEWIDIAFTLDFNASGAGSYKLYIAGVLADTDVTANIAAPVIEQWNVGDVTVTGNQSGMVFGEYAAFGRVLTAIEVSELYNLQRPLVDAGSQDTPGIYILDGKFQVMSATTGNRIEITPEEIAGYDGGNTKQFYLQASDGKAVAGGGAVTLDADGISIAQGAADVNTIKWYSGTDLLGNVYSNWGGGAGDIVVTWITAREDDVTAAGAWVQIMARDDASNEVSLRVKADKVIDTLDVHQFILRDDTPTDWLDFKSDDDSFIRFADAAGGNAFVLKDSNGAEVFEVNSNGHIVGLTIATDEGSKWNVGDYTGGVLTDTGYITIQIDGSTYYLLARAA